MVTPQHGPFRSHDRHRAHGRGEVFKFFQDTTITRDRNVGVVIGGRCRLPFFTYFSSTSQPSHDPDSMTNDEYLSLKFMARKWSYLSLKKWSCAVRHILFQLEAWDHPSVTASPKCHPHMSKSNQNLTKYHQTWYRHLVPDYLIIKNDLAFGTDRNDSKTRSPSPN